MSAQHKGVTIFLCSSPLQLIHAHLVRHDHLNQKEDDCFLFVEGEVPEQLIIKGMWTSITKLESSKRAFGSAQKNITTNLESIFSAVHWEQYSAVHLIISDLYWLMNNVAMASLSRRCKKARKRFSFSILDEGAVVYTGDRLGWKRRLRCLGRSAYLFLNGLETVVVTDANADYRHPWCKTVYCLHPSLLRVPPQVPKVAIDPERLREIYSAGFGELRLAPRSALYLSQPVYQTLGMERHSELVCASRDVLGQQGIRNFYYKPHHFDSVEWRATMEKKLGFLPIPNGHGLPVEVLGRTCNAEIIFGHFSSALLNLHAYGYQGRVVACALKQVSSVFLENQQFLEYLDVLARIGTIETLDPFEPTSTAVDTVARSLIGNYK
jgi:hypothetical protein